MEVKLIGIDTKSPLDIHNFLNLEGIKIIYAKGEADRIMSFTNKIVEHKHFDIDGFYNLLLTELNQNLTRFPLQGKVLIEFESMTKKIIPSNNLYIINFNIKLYLSNDIAISRTNYYIPRKEVSETKDSNL